jgi:hypothetical protein
MEIELSNLTFTDEDDVVPTFGVEELFSNSGIANTLAGNDRITGVGAGWGFSIFNSGYGTLITGEGNDTITGTGYFSSIVNHGTLNTEEDNDIITVTGVSGNLANYGTLNMGEGDDTITATLDVGGQASPTLVSLIVVMVKTLSFPKDLF